MTSAALSVVVVTSMIFTCCSAKPNSIAIGASCAVAIKPDAATITNMK